MHPDDTAHAGANQLERLEGLRHSRVQQNAIFGFAEVARRAGALRKAKGLYAQLGIEGPVADQIARLRHIFSGEPAPVAHGGEIAPAPFVHIGHFLPDGVARSIATIAMSAESVYAPAKVDTYHESVVDPTSRCSWVSTDAAPLRALFLPYLRAALTADNIARRLGAPSLNAAEIDLQATCHSDGAFFRAHRDADESHYANRAVSFAYYFHKTPRAFKGGDLLLYDCNGAGAFTRERFTRILPEHNSIVFFPSGAVHEVTPVEQRKRDFDAGRFALVGWISARPM